MKDNFEGIEFNEVERTKVVRKKKHYLARVLIVLGIAAVLLCFINSDLFGLREIAVEGNHFYNREQVINLSKVKEKDNLFFGDSIKNIPEVLQKDPYFSEVKVKRTLPGKITISVRERKQIAAVAYGRKFVVIDKEGTVLRKSEVNPKLTTVHGLTISKLKLGKKINVEEETELNLTIKLLNAMEEGNIFFKKIDMSRVVIKAYIYDNLIVKGTPKQIISSLEKGELQKVVNNLIKHDTTRGTINMGDHNYMSFSPNF